MDAPSVSVSVCVRQRWRQMIAHFLSLSLALYPILSSRFLLLSICSSLHSINEKRECFSTSVYPSVCDVWLWPSLRFSTHPYIHILKPLSLACYLITHLLFHSLALSLTLSVSFFLPLSLSYSSFQSDSQIPCPENIVHGSSFEEDILPRVAFTTKLHAYVCVLVWKRARVCVCAVAPRGARTACARVRVRVCVFAARVCLGIRDPTSVIPWQVDIRLRCCLCHLTQIVKLNP